MVLVYATTADLAAPPWSIDPAPAGVESLLWRASLLVARHTMAAIYATDETGMPTDADTLAAFRDATCSQVSTWVTLGVDPSAAGADAATSTGRVAASKSIAGASLTYTGVEEAAARRAATATALTQEALAILAMAGLLSSPTWVTG